MLAHKLQSQQVNGINQDGVVLQTAIIIISEPVIQSELDNKTGLEKKWTDLKLTISYSYR